MLIIGYLYGGNMKLAIIGSGVMGSAFAKALSKKYEIGIVGRSEEKVAAFLQNHNVRKVSIEQAFAEYSWVILAIKQKDLAAFAQKHAKLCRKETIIVSLLAGISQQTLSELFTFAKIVRVMPNLPITCGSGVVGVVSSEDASLQDTIKELFSSLGLVYFLPETLMDSFTAVCGSSPAFILAMIDAMIEGAVALGIPGKDAKELVMQSFLGTVNLLQQTKEHPAVLKMNVCSPGGTTIAGLEEMEKHAFRSCIFQTLHATASRSKELSRFVKND